MDTAGDNNDSVAIIGMACRVAGANSTSQLWDNLASSVDVQRENPRFSGFYSPGGGPKKGHTNVNRGYFIDDDIDQFDNVFFSIPPVEASSMDPQQRILLEVTYEAVENAGIPLAKFAGTKTSVYTGMTWSDYSVSLSRDLDLTPKYMSTGGCNAIAANRISYFFDLHGPSAVVDTACSSTMVALHQGVQDLASGAADMVVVNGSNLLLNPDVFVHMSELGFLSPTGRCRSFDADGNGYVRAEGIIAIILKPLQKALADGDPIRAVIRGSSLNQDGRTNGITQPNSDAQRANMQDLYERISMDPKSIQYFEAHGTGTAVGDPLELSAIDAVYRDSHTDHKLVVGSVKSNIGHLEAVAALAGIVKAVESLERGLIPPQMHFYTPNPKIDFTAIEIPQAVLPWPETPDKVRRAAVNSFGFGGTNGHAVLESAPEESTSAVPGYQRPFLFKVSAVSQNSLQALANDTAAFVEGNDAMALQDLAHTLVSRRSTFKHTRWMTASNGEELVAKLRAEDGKTTAVAEQAPKRVAFVFTGQGAQWPSMGKQLLESSPLFRSVVQQCAEVLRSLPDGPAWDPAEELSKGKTESSVYQSSFSQPLCTILQIGIVELWKSWGVEPVAVVGHSSGEVAAGYCAGHLTLRDAVVVAYYRGLHLSGGPDGASADSPAKKGSMAAVGVGEEDAVALLKPFAGRLSLACVNSPGSCTISGDEDAIVEVVDKAKTQGLFCRQLRVESAYHSHHMLPKAPVYTQSMLDSNVTSQRDMNGRTCDMFSSVRGRLLKPGECVPAYWTENMTSTVRFSAALGELLLRSKIDALVEIGPHPALKGPSEDIMAALKCDPPVPYAWSCNRGQPDLESMLENAAALVSAGLGLKTDLVNAFEQVDERGKVQHIKGRVLTNLPRYAWDHTASFWGETDFSWSYRHRSQPRHELLGAPNALQNPLSRSWRNLLMLGQVSWLKDMMNQQHVSALSPAVPVLMAIEAARQGAESGSQAVSIRDLVFHYELPASVFETDDSTVELHTQLDRDDVGSGSASLCIYAKANDQWQKLVSCTVITTSEPASLPARLSGVQISDKDNMVDFSRTFALPVLEHIDELRFTATDASGTVTPERMAADSLDFEYPLDPAVLDNVLRLPQAMLVGSGVPRAFRISGIEALTISFSTEPVITAAATLNVECATPSNATASAAVTLVQQDGTAHMQLQNVGLVADSGVDSLLRRSPPLRSIFFKPLELPDITYYNTEMGPTQLHDVLELITHKWPMADFGLAGLEAGDVQTMVDQLSTISRSERPRFRSVTVAGAVPRESLPGSSRVRGVDKFAPSSKFHVLCGPWASVSKHLGTLREDGLVLLAPEVEEAADSATSSGEQALEQLDVSLIAPVVQVPASSADWKLARRAPSAAAAEDGNLEQPRVPIKIFHSGDSRPDLFAQLENEGYFDFKQTFGVVESTTDTAAAAKSAFDVVVFDCDERSILIDTKGDDLMVWLQSLLPHLRNMLWISRQNKSDPHNGVAASFVRTLCSEHPTIRAVSLLFIDEPDQVEIERTSKRVYEAMLQGRDSEGELVVRKGIVHALRHIPDDELSASLGLVPPVSVSAPAVELLQDYHLSCQTCGTVGVVNHPSSRSGSSIKGSLPPPPAHVEVMVEASLVDHEDLLRVQAVQPYAQSALGLFVVGRVSASHLDGDLQVGDRVFGWSQGAHAARLTLPASRLTRLDAAGDATADLVHHAYHTIAAYLLEHAARLRRGDTIRIRGLPAALSAAITRVASQHYEATVVVITAQGGDSDGEERVVVDDVEISLESRRGLVVNGKVIILESLFARYYAMPPLPAADPSELQAAADWWPQGIETFTLDQCGLAFAAAAHQGEQPRVLLHSAPAHAGINSLVTYVKPAKLFHAGGAYVLLGGLGGVGKELIRWMVGHGAKYFATISRNGPATAGAAEFTREVEALGGQLQVLRGDAAVEEELTAAMASIRSQHHRILGCFNLAIFLDDAPLATMTGKQWDAPLQAKIATSWNLHRATMDDELDFFILFSSCVTMIGSRMQASYSTGNMFLNQLALHRRSVGKTAVSLLVPALRGFGVLDKQDALLAYMDNAGYFVGDRDDLLKLAEAAVQESRVVPAGRPVIESGLQMFQNVDGKLQAGKTQTQVFWAEFPEFGFLMDHVRGGDDDDRANAMSLPERLASLGGGGDGDAARELLLEQFLQSLADILGYSADAFDPTSPIAAYGLDSLNAVACRYWFFKELGIEISVFDVLGCKSINDLVSKALSALQQTHKKTVPDPVHYDADAVDHRPLSRSQSRLWFVQRFLEDKTALNLLLVCHVEGSVDVKLLETAWRAFIARHEVLRSRIVETADGPQQLPLAEPLFQLDLCECSDAEYQSVLDKTVAKAQGYGYRVDDGELVRCWLVRSPTSAALLLGSHHLAWDRASSVTVFREVSALYKGLASGQAAVDEMLPPVPYQFLDYTLWQEQCLSTPEFAAPLVEYWREQLQGIPEACSLLPLAKTDRRPAVKGTDTGHAALRLPPGLARRIKEFCAAQGLTGFMFMTAGVAALVHRLTGDPDVLVGISDSDRGHSDFDSMVGFTVNMLAIRCRPGEQKQQQQQQQDDNTSASSYADYLATLRQTCLDAYQHRALPFDYLVQTIGVPRRSAHSPVFQVIVNYQVTGAFPPVDFGGFRFDRYDHYNARTQTDMSIDIEEAADGALDMVIEFDTALYDAEGMAAFGAMYRALIEDVLETCGTKPLAELQLVSRDHRERMESVLRPEVDEELVSKCYASLFDKHLMTPSAAAAAATAVGQEDSDKPAIIDGNATINTKGQTHRSVSYKETRDIVARGVSWLQAQGLQRGEIVAVACEPGADMVLAVYSLLAAGCAYLPVNDVPDERLRSMLEDVGATRCSRMLVDSDKNLSRGLRCGLKRANMLQVHDLVSSSSSSSSSSPYISPLTPQDTLGCIFTSGSTGRPKGVELTHGALRLWHEGYHGMLGTSSSDRLLLASSLNFDMALISIYGSVVAGATLVVAPREAMYSPQAMVDLVVDQEITSLIMTPTQLNAMLASPNRDKLRTWTSLRTLALGGEPISHRTVAGFFGLGLDAASLWNAYGPTETTLVVSLREIDRREAATAANGSASLSAHPVWPASFRIVDEQQDATNNSSSSDQALPLGVAGELLVGGPTVCSGYINRPELTVRAFVEMDGQTWYRTGDSVRLDATTLTDDNNNNNNNNNNNTLLHFLGRVGGDRQVKIRGQRTELSEIEEAIWQALDGADGLLPVKVDGVAVVYRKEEELLVAYLSSSSSEAGEQAVHDLKRHLRSVLQPILPVYMRPGAYVVVDGPLPTSISGKTDYRAIAAWDAPIIAADSAEGRGGAQATSGGSSGSLLLPSSLTPVQKDLALIWGTVTGVEISISGADDDFFSAGGHSLALMQVQTAMAAKFGVTVPLAGLFAEPTLAGMERLILAAGGGHDKGAGDAATAATTATAAPVHPQTNMIDWAAEISVPTGSKEDTTTATTTTSSPTSSSSSSSSSPPKCFAVTGASSLIGIYFVHLMLTTTTDTRFFCLAEPSEHAVADQLRYTNLLPSLTAEHLARLTILTGDLRHPTLGLSAEQVARLDDEVDIIYNLAADVSLFGNYAKLEPGNVGVVRFLIDLARGGQTSKKGNKGKKPLHHLSTWAVPHLQSWHDTVFLPDHEGSRSSSSSAASDSGYTSTSSSSGEKKKANDDDDKNKDKDNKNDHHDRPAPVLDERVMSHFQPGPADESSAYLKVRWACEMLVRNAAEAYGIPVSIIRTGMCAMPPPAVSGGDRVALTRTDINRRILRGALQTGLMPDFGSDKGGGMSWITFDFLAQSVRYLTLGLPERRQREQNQQQQQQQQQASAPAVVDVWHIVPETHMTYRSLARLLGDGLDGYPLRPVPPKLWFAALRAEGDAEMDMQAEVLDRWCRAGWVPFGIDGQETLRVLRDEAGLRPPEVTRELLLQGVVGAEGF